MLTPNDSLLLTAFFCLILACGNNKNTEVKEKKAVTIVPIKSQSSFPVMGEVSPEPIEWSTKAASNS